MRREGTRDIKGRDKGRDAGRHAGRDKGRDKSQQEYAPVWGCA